ncbi:MAG: hypothetical protein F4Z04_07205 [Acidobacteria bacterium]|nr:hypothetical protein [Acidobacteriota bacterium]
MVIAASLLGALTGILTGLVPGIHVNTVTALLLASSASCASLGIEYSALLAFTCALAISHTFFDVVPGLFLGVPGDESFALLPGHRLVRQGRGTLALRLSVAGSALGLAIGLVVVAALLGFGNLIGAAEEAIGSWMFLVLAGVSLVLIVSDSRRGWSLVVFLASGLLGVAVFGSPLVAGGLDAPVNALFPALAGLFGVAGLLFAIATTSAGEPPPPPDVPANPSARGVAWPGVRGGLAGLLVGVLPGLGAANAATLLLLLERGFGRHGDRDAQDRAYLVTTSSLNTSEALFAIAALYLIGRSRSGASIAVEQVLGGIASPADLGWIALFMIAAGIVAAVIMWWTGATVAAGFQAVDQTGLNWSVVAFLAVLTLALLGAGGLVILICATAVGLIPLLFGVRRAQLMGFFLVPTMLFYSGYQVTLVDWLSLEQRTAPLLPSITLGGIAVALVASVTVALATYYVAGRIDAGAERPVRTNGSFGPEFSSVGRLAGAAIGATAGALLLFALFGGAYPPEDVGSFATLTPPSRTDGRIERVIDADTADIASACRRFRVRFSGVDAPELGRPDGDRARDWVQATFEDRPVRWSAVGVDAYGRFLGDIELLDGTSVNQEIIRQGYAQPFSGRPAEPSRPGRARSPRSTLPTSAPAAPEPVADRLPWDDNGNGRVSCAEARAHGIAPVRRGHPAYAFMTDGDGDGVVCE